MRLFAAFLPLFLVALTTVGCSEDSALVGPEANDRLTLVDQEAIRSVAATIGVTYAEDTGRMLRPSRQVNAEISFRVVEEDPNAHTAQGRFELRNDIGDRYLATIEHIDFKADGSVTFWGPLVSVSDREEAWLFVSVKDEGRGEDAFTFQFGPPAPHPNVALPDAEGTETRIVRGDIVIDTGRMRTKALF